MADYTNTINCNKSPEQAYKAITEEMSAWWTEEINADFLKVGDQAKTSFGGEAFWVFEAQTLNAPNLIELKCVGANYIHPDMTEDMREEWLDTTLRFEISQDSDNTTITFTHLGLVPDMGCFDVCKDGWDHFILGSLKNYLDGKSGNPNSY